MVDPRESPCCALMTVLGMDPTYSGCHRILLLQDLL